MTSVSKYMCTCSTLHDFETDCREWLTWLDATKWLWTVRPSGFLFFRAVCTSFHSHPHHLPCSSVSLCYLNHTVPKQKCLREHSCMSSLFAIAILNGTCSLRSTIIVETFWKWSAANLNSKIKLTIQFRLKFRQLVSLRLAARDGQ